MAQKKKLFIRFNELPKDGKSFIYDENDLIIGKREGVSVYNAIKIDGRYTPALPTPTTKAAADEFFKYTIWNTTGQYEKMFLVSGDVIDSDEHNCPIITNVTIVDELNFDEIFPDRRVNETTSNTSINRIDNFVENTVETVNQVKSEIKTNIAETAKEAKAFVEEVKSSQTFGGIIDKANNVKTKTSRFAKASAAFVKTFFEN